jgi:hypothetical protein
MAVNLCGEQERFSVRRLCSGLSVAAFYLSRRACATQTLAASLYAVPRLILPGTSLFYHSILDF